MTHRLVAAVVVVAAALTLGLSSSAGAQAVPETPSIDNIPASNVVGGGFMASVQTNSDGAPSVTSSTPAVCSVSTADDLTVSYLAPGTCTLTAHTAGTSNFDEADGSPQNVTVDQATLTLGTTPDTGSGVVNATVSDSASLSGQVAGITPTGSVTYTLDNGTCAAVGSEVGTDTATQMLNADGTVPGSGSFGPLAAGTYVFEATYSGDTNYNAITTPQCEAFSITKVGPGVSTTVVNVASGSAWVDGGADEFVGATAHDTATVTGATDGEPTGTVTYQLFDGTCGSGTPTTFEDVENLVNGVPNNSQAVGPLAAGSYFFTATYSGDSTYSGPVTGACEPFTVGQDTLTLSTTPNAGSGLVGASVSDSAGLSGQAAGFAATGTVTYTLDNGTCALVGSRVGTDTATVTLSGGAVPGSGTFGPLGAGSYVFEATYSGDTNYKAISTPQCEAFSIGKASLTLDTTPNAGSGIVGASVSDSAGLSGQAAGFAATGTVTYTLDNGTCALVGSEVGTDTATVTLSGGTVPGSGTFGPLAAGSYVFEVTYSGDTDYNAVSTAQCEAFSIVKGNLTLSTSAYLSSDNGETSPINGTSVALGSSVFDQATLSGADAFFAPQGTVTYTWFTDGTCTGTGTSAGSLAAPPGPSSATPVLGTGNYSFMATYSGDSNYNAITSSTAQCESFSVNLKQATITSSVEISGSGTPVTAPIPLGSTVVDTSTISGTAAGITATGSVTYTLDGGTCGASTGVVATDTQPLSSSGAAPSSTASPSLAAGSYFYTAAYGGDVNYGASTDTCESFTVAKATPAAPLTAVDDATTGAAWSSSEVTGAAAEDSATVSGVTPFTPTGAVTYSYFANATCASPPTSTDAQTLSGGLVPKSAATSPLAAGTHSFDAQYSGDANYSASAVSSCEPFTVGKATPAVTTVVFDASTNAPWANDEVVGATAYDTATVTGVSVAGFTPTGTVTYSFFPTNDCTGTPSSTDQVTLLSGGSVPRSATVSLNAAQEYTYEAVYNGDPNYTASPPAACELFGAGKIVPTSPSVSNLPFDPIAEGGFLASVSTTGDGQRSVTSSTPGVCTVGADGLTVTYVAPGSCTLIAQVGLGSTHFAGTGSPQTFTILPIPHGYWLVGSDGGIFTFGDSQFWGSTGNIHLQRPVVGITPTTSRNGYWLVASDGGIFSFGDAGFYGSIPGVGLHPAGSGVGPSLNAPIVAMVPSTTGHGYFMVASDGGVFAFGDARFAGSCPGIGGCAGSAVAVVPDATGNGYWLFTSTGNVYTFGDAPYYGADPGTGVAVTSAVATPDGHGYWILFANGAVAPFGDAPGLGSPLGYTNASNPATTIFPTANGGGYWVGSARGDVFAYGDAPFLGSMAATPLNGLIVAASGY